MHHPGSCSRRAAGFGLVAGSSAQQTVDYGQLLNHKASAHTSLLAARAASSTQAFQEASLPSSGELQLTNLGQWLPVISTGNVITPVTGDGTTTGKILYAPSEADDPGYRAAISAGADAYDLIDRRVAQRRDAAAVRRRTRGRTSPRPDRLRQQPGRVQRRGRPDGAGRVLRSPRALAERHDHDRGLQPGHLAGQWQPLHELHGQRRDASTTASPRGLPFRDALFTTSRLIDRPPGQRELAAEERGGGGEVVYSNGSGAVQLAGTGQWGTAVGNACSCALTVVSAWVDKGSALFCASVCNVAT
jgi:hypothetical protein